MKLIRAGKDRFVFQLAAREKGVLLQILKLYPCIPPASQRLSRSAGPPNAEAAQKLLDEALAEQRTENRRKLEALLADPKRLAETQTGWRLSIRAGELEWLLQVLNDIRIGSWVQLGSPEIPAARLTEQTAPHFWAMEVAGSFQAALLQVLEGTG